MNDRDVNEPMSELGQEAVAFHVLFLAFIEGGFTEDQACRIIAYRLHALVTGHDS